MKFSVTAAICTLALMAPGCKMSSGRVGAIAMSDDGTVLAFEDEIYREVYVADGKSVRHFGGSCRFALSHNGSYLLMVNSKDYRLNGGDELILCEVASGKRWTTTLPQVKIEVISKKFEYDGPYEQFDCLFHVDDTPAITIVLPEGVSRSCIRWEPGGDWKDIESPADMRKTPFAEYGEKQSLIVQFPRKGIDDKHTVWVRPDGKVVELLRNNEGPLFVVLMPVAFWNPIYWVDLALHFDTTAIVQDEDPNVRLAKLIAARKAAATQPTTAPR